MLVEIKLSDGMTKEIEMLDYNAQEVAELLNDDSKNMVALGDVVVQRYSVTRISPVIKQEEVPEEEV